MIERKCPNCSEWNKEEDHCVKCGEALSPDAVMAKREQKRIDEEAAKPPSKVDLFLERAKNSKYMMVRWGYYLMYSVFMVIGAFGAFMAWLVAMANG